MSPSRGRRWQTRYGQSVIQDVVKKRIPAWKDGLFEWQLTIVAWILDGEDVLCITATGDGKSALFRCIPLWALGEHANLGLQVTELSLRGVNALACTSESLTEARKTGRHLGGEISGCKWPIMCIDPEHLMDKQWEAITDSRLFRENFSFVCIDEAHLIDEWGVEFRPAYRHIGPFIRGRLPQHISVFALTATLKPGAPTRSISRSLGFQSSMFLVVRRSNERPNIQFLLSPLSHGLGGDTFPDLLRFLNDNRKAVIYCATIELCWRVYVYLLRLLPPGHERLRRVRLYHAMCWPDKNEETVRMIRDDPGCQVVVATVAFGQGFNIRALLDSIMLGVPQTLAQTLQQAGRVVRDQTSNGRAVVFTQNSAYKSAEKYLAQDPARRTQTNTTKTLAAMSTNKALMLTIKSCLIAFINKTYGNTGENALLDCIAAERQLPCSNCLPHFVGPLFFPPSSLPIGAPPLPPFLPVNQTRRLTAPTVTNQTSSRKLPKAMRARADADLRRFRDKVHKAERERVSHGYTPASSYFPNPAISTILDQFFAVSAVETIKAIIPTWKHYERHGLSLYLLIKDLQGVFFAEFDAVRLEKNAKARAKRREERLEDEDMDGEVEELGSEPEEQTPVVPVRPVMTTRKRAALDDTTNEQPKAKRSRVPLEKAAVVSASFRPQYVPRKRGVRANQENILS
ncbi:P-loop containing nucleoside triphosphate hydrolase protein [Favolaschia claudopus]|uniref:DNA 3'-5' helicase n=1 Tax=Favolaschia claudopus TaxID=2862362 RepID=A0AAW0AVK1_9AGAR